LDLKDRQIIAELQKDGRLSNQELSERVALSPSPCLRRLRNLEDSGVIKGYTALVDETAFGLPVTVFVEIRLTQHTHAVNANFEQKIRNLSNVLDCYVMTGDADYLLRVLVESLQDYESFVRNHLHRIEGIAAIKTSFAYGVVKRSNVYPWVG
jgi:DNA-binding Lrp family transcriptional regulator